MSVTVSLPQTLLLSFFPDLSLRHGVRLFNGKKLTARKGREIHDVEQTKKVTSFVTRVTSFEEQVNEVVFGVNIFDLVLGVQVDSVKQSV